MYNNLCEKQGSGCVHGGHLGLQIQWEVGRPAFGGFDSHTFPPLS